MDLDLREEGIWNESNEMDLKSTIILKNNWKWDSGFEIHSQMNSSKQVGWICYYGFDAPRQIYHPNGA